MSKITLATLKSFIKKNAENLYIREKSSFDGMVDGVVACDRHLSKAIHTGDYEKHNLGYKGIWLVGGSRNFFSTYQDNDFTGIEVSNCCGSFIVGVKK
jgi:hypothetical protein